jgi:hypothetical protein
MNRWVRGKEGGRERASELCVVACVGAPADDACVNLCSLVCGCVRRSGAGGPACLERQEPRPGSDFQIVRCRARCMECAVHPGVHPVGKPASERKEATVHSRPKKLLLLGPEMVPSQFKYFYTLQSIQTASPRTCPITATLVVRAYVSLCCTCPPNWCCRC